jgi:hypothetical protein
MDGDRLLVVDVVGAVSLVVDGLALRSLVLAGILGDRVVQSVAAAWVRAATRAAVAGGSGGSP